MDLAMILGEMPINPFVIVGCCVVGWLMKTFMPTDNRFIPLTLTILGAVLFPAIEGVSIVNVIVGAFHGSVSTGLHQIYKQHIGSTKDKDEILPEGDEA